MPTAAPSASNGTDPFAFLIGLITPSSPSNPPSNAPSARTTTAVPSPASASSAPVSAAAAAVTGTQTSNTAPAANAPELVVPANFHSRWTSQSADTSLRGGGTTTLTVRYRNTGAASWVKGVVGQQANLAVNGEGAKLAYGWPTADRIAIQMEDVVAPGELVTFEFDVRAPTVDGSYRLDVRPVVEGTTWLEDEGVFFTVTSHGIGAREALTALASLLETLSTMAWGVVLLLLPALLFLALRLLPHLRRAGSIITSIIGR